MLVVDNVIEDDNSVPNLVKGQPVDNAETTTDGDESFFTPLGKYLSFYVLQTVIKESIVTVCIRTKSVVRGFPYESF